MQLPGVYTIAWCVYMQIQAYYLQVDSCSCPVCIQLSGVHENSGYFAQVNSCSCLVAEELTKKHFSQNLCLTPQCCKNEVRHL
jgi:hypothetical protein